MLSQRLKWAGSTRLTIYATAPLAVVLLIFRIVFTIPSTMEGFFWSSLASFRAGLDSGRGALKVDRDCVVSAFRERFLLAVFLRTLPAWTFSFGFFFFVVVVLEDRAGEGVRKISHISLLISMDFFIAMVFGDEVVHV